MAVHGLDKGGLGIDALTGLDVRITLIREPQNSYDKNAFMIFATKYVEATSFGRAGLIAFTGMPIDPNPTQRIGRLGSLYTDCVANLWDTEGLRFSQVCLFV